MKKRGEDGQMYDDGQPDPLTEADRQTLAIKGVVWANIFTAHWQKHFRATMSRPDRAKLSDAAKAAADDVAGWVQEPQFVSAQRPAFGPGGRYGDGRGA